MNKLFLILTSIILTLVSFGQGNNCEDATSLGTLPAPSNCPNGSGTTVTYNGTTVGATAENPYSSLACMDAPAADVWISFVASGNEMDLNFTSTMNGANIGIYAAVDCNDLTGMFCENNNTGNITTTLSPFNPGQTYYMQISGESETDVSDFTLELTNFDNCDLCVLNSNLTANPPPVNGFYLPGQTVQFCLEITDFEQVSSNWLHGVAPSFGASWDTGTLTPISSPTAGGGYTWIWINGPNGPGWYVDDGDGNVTNNFGDPDIDGTGSWTFCWEITVSTTCTPNGDLSSLVNTTGDGETGSWTSTACTGDPDMPFQAAMICCAVPDVSFTDESCPGAADGTFSATGQGGLAPYDYVFENSAGTVIYTENNVADGVASTATGLVADTYTVTVTDDNGCEQLVDVTISSPPCPTPNFDPEPGDLTVQCPSDIPAMTNLTWNDACMGSGSVAGTDNSDGGTCPEIITRTWEFTNACGNSVSATQIITVDDTQAPDIAGTLNVINDEGCALGDATPAVTTVADLEAMGLTISDNCTADADLTVGSTETNTGTCPIVITRTYTITDECGNESTVTQTINVDDTQVPDIAGTLNVINDEGCALGDATPAVTTVAGLEAMGVTISDNCTADADLTVSSTETNTGTCPIVITRTYTITDECGNESTVTQTINVDDTQVPDIAGTLNVINDEGCALGDATPAVTTVAGLEAMGVTISDNCTADADLTVSSTETNTGTCPIVITRTYTITDECGNESTVTQTINVDDTQAPDIAGTLNVINDEGCALGDATPAVTTVAGLEAMGVAISDNCTADADLTVSSTETNTGTCPIVITRTYTITDECGNESIITQTINVDDTQAPDITGTLNVINDEGCALGDATPAVTTVADLEAMGVTISDNCTADTDLTLSSTETNTGTCPIVITRTYTITDECGNESTVAQTINVEDTQVPDIAGTLNVINDEGCALGDATPAVTTVADLEAMGVTISDNCTADADLTVSSSETNTGTCPIVITRTYTITDECGNESTVAQTINVDDTQVPDIAGTLNVINDEGCALGDATPAVTTVAGLEAMGVTISDNCTADADLTVSSTETNTGSCPIVITRTYTITDECGNESTVTQTINVDDTQVPTASNAITTIVECITDVPAADPAVVTDEADNCGAPTVAFVSETSDNNTCNGEELTRTYSVTDLCGNSINVTHTIVIDSYTPTFTLAGTDPSLCGASDGFITVSGLDPNTDYVLEFNGGAPLTITTDGAGEYVIGGLGSGSYTGFTVSDIDCPSCQTVDGQTITLTDPNPPSLDAGVDQEVCSGTAVTLTADNPDGAIITWNNGVTDGTAFTPAVGTVTYTVTADLAGCINTDQVDVTVVPTIDALTCPGQLTATCDLSEQPAYADFDAFITAGGSATIDPVGVIDSTSFILLDETSDGLSCPETVTRTYQIADTCGVTATCTQEIVIHDLIAPTASNPAPINVECITDVPAADPAVVTDEADNCGTPTVTFVSEASDGLSCPETITRTYAVTDSCGNSINVTQDIIIEDITPPTASNPSPINVECITDVPAADPAVVTDEADNCGTPTVTFVSEASDGLSCPETITRTYAVTDSCGNSINVTQDIIIEDITPPTASNPAALLVECITDVPAADPAVVTDEADNCGTPTVAFVSETSDNNTCNGEELTRTYSVTDSCGNSINVTHTIVIDSYTPTFTLAGTDPSLCGASDGFITVSGLDPNTDYVLEFNGGAPLTITTDGAGEYVIGGLGSGSYTGFTVSDIDCPSCQTVDGQTITLTDPNPPAIDAGVDQTVCDGEPVTLTADNPDGATITWDNGVTDGTAFTPGVGTITYTVTADLDNCIATDQVDVTVNPLPVIDAGTNQTVCDGTSVTLTADNPDGATITWDNGVTDGTAFTPGIGTITYTVTGDLASCISTDQVDVTVNPNPVFTLSYTDPTACGAADGTITIEGLDPNETYDYSYNGGAVQTEVSNAAGEIVIGGLLAGSYTDFEVTLNGCTTTDNTQLNLVDPNAPAIDAGVDQTVCDGEPVTLTADNPDGATITWDNGVTDGTAFTPGVGTITYTVTADLLDCISTDQVTVTVNPLPDVDAGNDISICSGDQVILSGSGANSYVWDNGVTDGQSFTPSETTTYTVIGASNGCEGTDQVTVVVNESETVAFEADEREGCVPVTTTFSNLSSGAGNECVWTLGDGTIINDCTGFSHTYTSTGCFDVTLTITSSEGCVSSETFTNYICVDSYPIADFTATPSIVTTMNTLVEFSNGSTGASDYEWSFGDGSLSNETNPSHNYPDIEDEVYEVELVAISQYGCTDTAVSFIEVREDLIFYVPNSFTPDGDQYNETFQPVFTSGFDPFDYNLLIFNRWGEVIFESNNANIGWDGTYGSSPEIVKDGTYIWKIEFKTKYTDERKVHSGHVNVLR